MPRRNSYLGKAVRAERPGPTGAEILRRVYYDYATSYLADQAYADLKKIPEAEFAAAGDVCRSSEARRQLYKGRRYPAAADEYQLCRRYCRRQDKRSAGLIQVGELARSRTAILAKAKRRRSIAFPMTAAMPRAEKWYQRLEIARTARTTRA